MYTADKDGWAASLVSHTLVGRYRVEGVLGVGGMGAVLDATQLALMRRVAVKVLLPGMRHDSTVMKRFQQEAQAASAVIQEGVVDVLDFDVDPEVGPILVMEKLEGENLLDRLRRTRMTLAETAAIMLPLLDTLAVVHSKGIVHRDLKPGNVFLKRHPETGADIVTILDFGISRVRDSYVASGITNPGTVLGTLRYMPPEQARGERVDQRADLYATGLMFFACLAGKPPHAGVPINLLPSVVPTQPPGDLRTDCPDLPEAVYAFWDRSIARDLSRRFTQASDMAETLRAAVSAAGIPAAGVAAAATTVGSSSHGPPKSPRWDSPPASSANHADGPTVHSPPAASPVSTVAVASPPSAASRVLLPLFGCGVLLASSVLAAGGAFYFARPQVDRASARLGAVGDQTAGASGSPAARAPSGPIDMPLPARLPQVVTPSTDTASGRFQRQLDAARLDLEEGRYAPAERAFEVLVRDIRYEAPTLGGDAGALLATALIGLGDTRWAQLQPLAETGPACVPASVAAMHRVSTVYQEVMQHYTPWMGCARFRHGLLIERASFLCVDDSATRREQLRQGALTSYRGAADPCLEDAALGISRIEALLR